MSQVADNLRGFLARVESAKYKLGEDPMVKEFQEIRNRSAAFKQDNNYFTEAGGSQENLKKNRYKDILPYDQTRVPITFLAEEVGSDYINASFIQGVDNQPRYIATQGPLSHTVGDFWRMIWQYQVKVIVMACREVEHGKKKCERYWPMDEEPFQYGPFTVSTVAKVFVNTEVVFRNLKVVYQEEVREIGHFQYIAWPDRGIPDSYSCFLEMIKLVRQHQGQHSAPICVHCSAGCGRTGVICTVEYIQCLLHKQKVPSDFSVFEVVMEMRRQRPSAIQTKEQYDFLYHAVTEMFEKQLNDLNQNYENLQQNKVPYYDDVAPQLKIPRAQAQYRKELSSCMSLPLGNSDMNDTYAVVQKRSQAQTVSSGHKSLPITSENKMPTSSHHQYDNVRRTMVSKPADQLYSTVAHKPNRTSHSPTTVSPVSASYVLAGMPGPPEATSNSYSEVNTSSAVPKKTPSFHNAKGDNKWSQNTPNTYAVIPDRKDQLFSRATSVLLRVASKCSQSVMPFM
ncbi:PREDICTED: tyrosine-protein phosphatase non-receptor type 18 [Nanorana parkeri]|uniref:tyrosine-protein phosphatase non-receptor type 18 n=1 Tax=Nanorana parkeri TaxID=125878 RepID=UPI000854B83B|nr:PREDICTED: tyrosine-protein phosphatase non-receptor type 18 [Nanorana parkeri]